MSAAVMYDNAVAMFTRGELAWADDNVRAMLVTGEYRPNQVEHVSRVDVEQFEVEPSGSYRLGGMFLDNRSVNEETPNSILLAGGAVGWQQFTGSFRYVIVYQDNGSRADDRLIACADVGDQSASNAVVSVDYSANGVAGFMVATQDGS